MGKKRVSYDCNDLDKPPNDHVINDHHHHHHHHRHHNQPKAKKIKPDAKLLHTLSSHLKKLGKSRSRNNTLSISTPPPPPLPPPAATVSHENRLHGHGHQCHRDHLYDWHKGFDSDRDWSACHDDHGDDIGVFKFGQEICWKTLFTENNEDLFGGDCVFAPDLNAGRKMVVVFEDGFGFGCGSYIPDPVAKWDNVDGGNCLYDVLKLSSQEDMINEFLKVNLFVS